MPETDKSPRYLNTTALARLERLRFSTRRRVEGSYSGRHASKRLGGSGEFVDYREYAPGDDLRRVDWKAMARMGRTYLKLFQDETDLSCTLLIDTSGSMAQGSRSQRNHRDSKLEWVQYFTSALAHLIILQRDSAGMVAETHGSLTYLPPTSSLQQRGVLLSAIENLVPMGKTRLAEALTDLSLRGQRRGALMVFSDFLVDSMEPVLANLRKFRTRGWETIAIHLVHPDEQRLPAGNAFRFVGLEGDGAVQCMASQVRRDYESRFQQHLDATRAALLGVGCDYHLVSTATSYLDLLRSFLIQRG